MHNFAHKLALGTVQFGLDYGISNATGKITPVEVAGILGLAKASGINLLDTAAAYGESEQVLGEQLREGKLQFNVVSKLPNCAADKVKVTFQNSLTRLGLSELYGYLVHDFEWFRQQSAIWQELRRLKQEGKVQKIGFSVYLPEQVNWLLETEFVPDLIQVPYSLFDQRFAPLFPVLQERGVEVHVRSVFLQGLFFLSPENLRPHFASVKTKLTQVRQLFAAHQIPVAAGLLCFAWLCEGIDKLVIGVESLQNLRENLAAEKWLEKTREIYPELLQFAEIDPAIILPTNWK